MITGSCHCGTVKWKCTDSLTEGVTACNCTLCSKYGALWYYGFIGEGMSYSGETKTYGHSARHSAYHFCTNCGGLAFNVLNKPDEQGRRRMAINVRMADDPKAVAALPIDHFDGLDTFEDLPRDGKTVKDLWF